MRLLCISTNILLVLSPQQHYSSSCWNEPGFRAAHIRCIKKSRGVGRKENCFDGIVIRSIIAINISLFSFSYQKLIQLLPFRRKHFQINSLPFSLPLFTSDLCGPTAQRDFFIKFCRELERQLNYRQQAAFQKRAIIKTVCPGIPAESGQTPAMPSRGRSCSPRPGWQVRHPDTPPPLPGNILKPPVRILNQAN